jgi:hypothetical protein
MQTGKADATQKLVDELVLEELEEVIETVIDTNRIWPWTWLWD